MWPASSRSTASPVGQAGGNHWGDAVTVLETTSSTPLLLQLPQRRSRQLHDHRPVGLGQDGGAELPRRAGAEVRSAHDLVRQGSRRRDLRARHAGGHYAVAAPGRADRLQPACACPTRPRTGPSCATGSACSSTPKGRRSWPRSRRRSTPLTPRSGLRRLRYFRELLGGRRRPEAGDLRRRLDAVGRQWRACLAVRQ